MPWQRSSRTSGHQLPLKCTVLNGKFKKGKQNKNYVCIAGKSCGFPPSLLHTQVDDREYFYPESVQYTCEADYELASGDGSMLCGTDGTFIGSSPFCEGKEGDVTSYTPPQCYLSAKQSLTNVTLSCNNINLSTVRRVLLSINCFVRVTETSRLITNLPIQVLMDGDWITLHDDKCTVNWYCKSLRFCVGFISRILWTIFLQN